MSRAARPAGVSGSFRRLTVALNPNGANDLRPHLRVKLFELLVVDNVSDNTRDVVRSATAECKRNKCIDRFVGIVELYAVSAARVSCETTPDSPSLQRRKRSPARISRTERSGSTGCPRRVSE